MSANAAAPLPHHSAASAPQEAPRIQVVSGHVPNAKRMSAWPLILLATLMVVLTVAVPMVINTQMAQRAYEIRDLKVTLAELTAQGETLETQVLITSSPQELEKKALAFGLVPAGNVGAISLEAGTVEGGEPAGLTEAEEAGLGSEGVIVEEVVAEDAGTGQDVVGDELEGTDEVEGGEPAQ